MNNKAQTSVEFLLLVAFGTLIFVIFFGVIQDRILSANLEDTSQEMEKLSTVIVGETDLAYRFGNGYSRNIWLPTFVGGIKYNASIINNDTLRIVGGDITNLYFFDYKVYGELKPGDNYVFSVFDAVYFNEDLSDVLTIKIDGSDSDWDSITDWYDISPVMDGENDLYYEVGPPYFFWDLKSATLWNDNDNLYIYVELYDPTINDFNAWPVSANKVDFMILFDTDPDSTPITGFSDDDFEKVIINGGIDYIVFDAVGGIANTTWENNDYLNTFSSDDPYIFYGISSSDFKFKQQQATSEPIVKYAFIDDYSMELSITLDKLELVAGDLISFVILSRDNSTGAVDYLPGDFDDFSGGFYQILSS